MDSGQSEHVGYYLGLRVLPVEPVQPDGWRRCQWENGKTWKHWAEQIKTFPWGSGALA